MHKKKTKSTRLQFQKEKRSYAAKREQEGGNTLVQPLGGRKNIAGTTDSLFGRKLPVTGSIFAPLLVS